MITTENLTKSYGPSKALHSVTFEVPKGAIAALVGRNGAGKSTLLGILAGLVRIDSGSVEVNGSEPSQDWHWLSTIAFVDQEASLNTSVSLEKLSRIHRDLNITWKSDLLFERCEQLQIPVKPRVRELSVGQRHSAAVLLALAKEPEVLLLDEPLSSMDVVTRRALLGIILSHCFDSGSTVLLSSHLLGDLERSCDHILLLAKQRVALSQPTEEILSTYFWMANSPENLELLNQRAVSSYSVYNSDARLLVHATDPDLKDALHLTPAGLEEIVATLMAAPPDISSQEQANG